MDFIMVNKHRCCDTATVPLKQVKDLLRKDLNRFFKRHIQLKKAQRKYNNTVMMGRNAMECMLKPTTFVWKLALWYSEMKRNIERFRNMLQKGIEASKISGAVWNICPLLPSCRKYVVKIRLFEHKKNFYTDFYHEDFAMRNIWQR